MHSHNGSTGGILRKNFVKSKVMREDLSRVLAVSNGDTQIGGKHLPAAGMFFPGLGKIFPPLLL